jgi:UDP-N-acetyl-D-mannosaminuronic acid dehydrogenase
VDRALFAPDFMISLRPFVLTYGVKVLTVSELANPARKTNAHVADLTVVGGAGHVGIPLVLSFAGKGLTVNVNDVNLDSIAALKAGRLPFMEYGADGLLTDALRDNRLIFTSDSSQISVSGPVVITIGTPVDEFLNPKRDVIQACIDSLLPYLKDGRLLVLRSTLFPGTTEWVDSYLKSHGRRLKVAFCPERVV